MIVKLGHSSRSLCALACTSSAPPKDRSLPVCQPRFPLTTPGLADGQECSTAPVGGLKSDDAELGAGLHFAAIGTAIPGIFTFTAPRWLRLVM